MRVGGRSVAGSVNGFFPTCASTFTNASASKLRRGDIVSSRPFVPHFAVLATGYFELCGAHNKGQFRIAGDGFIGFKFNTRKGDQYGWAHVRALGYPENKFELIDYAYRDPGDRIRAGQRAGGHDAVALESLGGLALGAAAILAWPKSRSSPVS